MEKQAFLAAVLFVFMLFLIPSAIAGSDGGVICSSGQAVEVSGTELVSDTAGDILLAQAWGRRCQCYDEPFRCLLPYPEPLGSPCFCFRCGDGFVVR